MGGDRWAITFDPTTSVVTGNVFDPAGGAPQFVYCERTGEDPSAGTITFSCQGADRCPATPCSAEQWSFIGEVPLPASFFEPPAP